ncbi:MotA/TolQ/ExbB proton channel family protein [Spiribacter halobius]|uniref:Flagellar motor protein MotA n=1 Tax=Sediminicurvatus halobius TaxID=2182432 RepID=A0A2U2N2I4_9GAMM|nr:MotA/TolQ/ExbB proton channel family protein [Spiribacter halobius]PWG63277.1 flagellar motor protein MotA [Spiribacter halobius]UEX76649.1 MotA/TolQ/ExbB proton channel family protein [Spiribacter halobius]
MPAPSLSATAALDTLLRLVGAGGTVIVLLLLASLVAVTIVLLKLWQFRSARIADHATPRDAAELYARGEPRAALELLEGSPHPAARVLERTITACRDPRVPAEHVREEAARLGADSLEKLRSHLRALEVIATLAPLLGLFGTVLGMIEAFRELELAGSQVSPALLSGGIWKALLTTAVGLAVAMPAVVFLNWFERRVERVAHEIEFTVSRVLTARAPGRTREAGDVSFTATGA